MSPEDLARLFHETYERLAAETAHRRDPYAAARALFTREDPHA